MRSFISLLFAFLLIYSASAQTIWSPSNGSIFSNVQGTVYINTPTGYTNTTRLALLPPSNSGVSMVIGEELTGNGHTSLSIGISAYKNGYSFLQSIHSSGSEYGNIIMNAQGGRVAIGTTDPGEYKLAVKGKIGAQEIKVTLTGWADHVFMPGYQLMSLRSLEAFINRNKHLPNVPSASEVKENGGVDLGAMNTKLLEKIEELTLHVIALNKRVEELEKEKQAASGKQ